MKLRGLFLILALAMGGATLSSVAQEKETKKEKAKPEPTQWCLAAKGPVEVYSKAGGAKTALFMVPRGSLLPVYASKRGGKGQWLSVVAVDPALLTRKMGWVDAAGVEVRGASDFPSDEKVLALSGNEFIDDFAAENVAVARYHLRVKGSDPVLVCYMGAGVLPHTRLQVIYLSDRKIKPGPYMEFSFSEMKSPITQLEVRDLTGDGNDLLITHEPYSVGPQNSGENLWVRRIVGNTFKSLLKVPISARNLASYPARRETLEPAAANIGRPGTTTTGKVAFRARGALTDVVWKGEVNIHALGREKPLETFPIEKIWTWDGAKFVPVLPLTP